ncbi:MAG: tetratricopeptide repeat protein, partial [Bacteroidota bacterium]
IGTVLQRKGKFDLAMQHFVKDLALVEELGDRQGISIALGLIGELYSVMGEFDKAVEYMQRNLVIGKELGYRKGVAKALNTLGDIFFYKDDYKTSLDYYDQAIQLTRDIGNKLVLGLSLVEKGKVLIAMKEFDAAHQHWEEAATLAQELDHAEFLFETKLLAARIFIAKGENTKAKTILDGLLQRKLGKREEASVHFKLSKIEEGAGHREKALALYRELFEETPMFVFKVRMEELEKL